jgi:SAM-dependent methyltransferase
MDPTAYEQMAAVEDRHWWFVGRRHIVKTFLQQLRLRHGSQILEVGCGTGGNLQMLAQFGKVHAVECHEPAAAWARAKSSGQVDIRTGAFPDEVSFDGRRFDLICMFDVLEHIDDDVAALRALLPTLCEGGKVVLTVPAYPSLYGPHDKLLHHRRRYTRRGLFEVVERAGLRVAHHTHFNALLLPVALLMRWKDRLFPPAVGALGAAGTAVPSALINRVLTLVFGMEACFLARMRFPAGLSILCVLEPAKVARRV